MAPSGDYHHFHPSRMGPAQSCQIRRRDLKFGVQQSAVDIDTQKADGRFHQEDFTSRDYAGTATAGSPKPVTAVYIITPARVLYCCIRMGSLLFFAFSWWGILLQAFAIIHFIRRRPDTFWLWIILIGGWLGALVYIAVEAIPDAGLLRQSFKVFPRRKRIRELEAAILDNPSAGNYEELGDLYLEEGQYARSRQAYDKSISSRTDSPDPFYRRGVAAIMMGDFAAALPDLERVVSSDPTYDFHRAAGLLAHAYANSGQTEKAAALFQQVVKISTSSETYYNYACFLASQQRHAEAREWARQILAKKPTMPGYLRRRERPWFRKANTLLLRLPSN